MVATKSGKIDSAVRKLKFAASVPADRVGQVLFECELVKLQLRVRKKGATGREWSE